MNRISILLPIYNPNLNWLGQLLDSLENQDYKNCVIYIIDDNSNLVKISDIKYVINKHLKKKKYTLIQNCTNVGSNRVLEKLIKECDSEYVAFCDQDDIWHKDRLSKCVNLLMITRKQMVCSDVNVINENNKILSLGIQKYNKNIKLNIKTNYISHLLFHNFVIGCTVLMKRSLALKALPFIDCMYHDHQLAICAALDNQLIVISDRLVDYRIHANNQTSMFKNIKTKEDYYNYHILRDKERILKLSEKYKFKELNDAKKFVNERIKNYLNIPNHMQKYKRLDLKTYVFEKYVLKNLFIFKLFIKLKKYFLL